MSTKRVEFQDIRTGATEGWIEYEEGEFYASDDFFMGLVRHYKESGRTDEDTIGLLAILNNGVLKGNSVE